MARSVKGQWFDSTEMCVTTLRLQVSNKQEWDSGEDKQVSLSFTCDYADGRNREWSRYTPAASLQMTVKGSIGDEFNLGDKVEVSVVTRKEEATNGDATS